MAASTQPHNPTCHRKSAGYPGKTADYPAVDPRSSSQIKPDSDITFNLTKEKKQQEELVCIIFVFESTNRLVNSLSNRG